MLSIKIYIKHSNYRIFYYKTLLKFMRTSFAKRVKTKKNCLIQWKPATVYFFIFFFLENLKGQECLWKKWTIKLNWKLKVIKMFLTSKLIALIIKIWYLQDYLKHLIFKYMLKGPITQLIHFNLLITMKYLRSIKTRYSSLLVLISYKFASHLEMLQFLWKKKHCNKIEGKFNIIFIINTFYMSGLFSRLTDYFFFNILLFFREFLTMIWTLSYFPIKFKFYYYVNVLI